MPPIHGLQLINPNVRCCAPAAASTRPAAAAASVPGRPPPTTMTIERLRVENRNGRQTPMERICIVGVSHRSLRSASVDSYTAIAFGDPVAAPAALARVGMPECGPQYHGRQRLRRAPTGNPLYATDVCTAPTNATARCRDAPQIIPARHLALPGVPEGNDPTIPVFNAWAQNSGLALYARSRWRPRGTLGRRAIAPRQDSAHRSVRGRLRPRTPPAGRLPLACRTFCRSERRARPDHLVVIKARCLRRADGLHRAPRRLRASPRFRRYMTPHHTRAGAGVGVEFHQPSNPRRSCATAGPARTGHHLTAKELAPGEVGASA